jgi:hypothetical protein
VVVVGTGGMARKWRTPRVAAGPAASNKWASLLELRDSWTTLAIASAVSGGISHTFFNNRS